MYEKFCILILISLKFVPKGQIDNNTALVQVMAWHRSGDKPLYEPMVTQFAHAYMQHWGGGGWGGVGVGGWGGGGGGVGVGGGGGWGGGGLGGGWGGGVGGELRNWSIYPNEAKWLSNGSNKSVCNIDYNIMLL